MAEQDESEDEDEQQEYNPADEPGPTQCPVCGVETGDGRSCMDCAQNEECAKDL